MTEAAAAAEARTPTILVVEDDLVLAELVRVVLSDEGYAVSVLNVLDPDAVRVAVNQLEPDCVLLDSSVGTDYGSSWDTAAWVHARGRPVPVVMFSAHTADTLEASEGTSDRARTAQFAAVIAKPFDLDALIETVAQAAGQAAPFNHRPQGDVTRNAALREKLVAAGAQDVEVSRRREWVTFATARGTAVLLYWWQRDGVYYVVRLGNGGPSFVGRFYDLAIAINVALTVGSK